MKNLLILVAYFFFTLPAHAEISNALDLGVYFDTYYQYNFNRPPQTNLPTAASPNPAGTTSSYMNDNYHNQITINVVELNIKKSKKDLSFLADLDFGDFVEQSKATVQSTTVIPNEKGDEVFKHIGQAHLTYSPSNFKLMTFQIGKFYSYLGTENAKAKDNWNYSHSTSFTYGTPLWHVGAAFGFNLIPSRLTTTFYYVHGWNTHYRHEKAPTWGLKTSFINLADVLDLNVGFITGKAEPIQSPAPLVIANNMKNKTVVNGNVSFKASEKFALLADIYYGIGFRSEDNNAKWWSMLTGFKFALPYNQAWLSPRLEFYEDKDNITTGTRQSIKSLTLTHNMTLTEGFQISTEARYDYSSQNTFRKADAGPIVPSYKKNQYTMTGALMFNI